MELNIYIICSFLAPVGSTLVSSYLCLESRSDYGLIGPDEAI